MTSKTEILLIVKRTALRNAMQLQMNYSQDFFCEAAWDSLNSFPQYALNPALVILDCEFFPIISTAPREWINTKWMVIVKDESNPLLIDALFHGANAFFSLKNEPEVLFDSIKNLMSKKEDADIIQLIRNISKMDKNTSDEKLLTLTNKEKEILGLMTQGLHFKAISIQTGNTYETIRTHVKRIYKKLGVETASEAVIKALKHLDR